MEGCLVVWWNERGYTIIKQRNTALGAAARTEAHVCSEERQNRDRAANCPRGGGGGGCGRIQKRRKIPITYGKRQGR
jgi:hypothetical protein